MALTPSKSTEYTNYSATPREFNKPHVWGAKLRFSYAKLTFTAAGTGTAQLIRLPAGKVWIIPDLCRVIQTAAGTLNADLHIGNAAYTKQDGSAGAAVNNSLADNLAADAAIDSALTAPASDILEFDSQDGVDIEAMYDTANSPASGDLVLMLAYSQGN